RRVKKRDIIRISSFPGLAGSFRKSLKIENTDSFGTEVKQRCIFGLMGLVEAPVIKAYSFLQSKIICQIIYPDLLGSFKSQKHDLFFPIQGEHLNGFCLFVIFIQFKVWEQWGIIWQYPFQAILLWIMQLCQIFRTWVLPIAGPSRIDTREKVGKNIRI